MTQDQFERALAKMPKDMRIITLCGSTKFKDEFLSLNKWLSLYGFVVLTVAFFGHADNETLSIQQKSTLDGVHKNKILLSDTIIVIDKDGYIGESTKSEIKYAEYFKTIKIVYLSKIT